MNNDTNQQPISIVKPSDWAVIDSSYLAVVVTGSLDGTEYCSLIPRTDWVAGSTDNDMLRQLASFHKVAPLVAWVYIPDLTGLIGEHIIAVVRPAVGIVAASGVVLQPTDAFQRQGRDIDVTTRNPTFIYPMPLLGFESSGFKHVGALQPIPQIPREQFFDLNKAPITHSIQATVTEESAKFDATDTLMGLSNGTELAAFQKLTAAATWVSSPSYFTMFRNGIVDVKNGIVIAESGEAWADSCVGSLFGDPEAIRLANYVSAKGQIGWIGTGTQLIIDDDRSAMIFCHAASLVNHAHWLMNSLLSVYYALEEIKNNKVILIAPYLPDYLRNMILQMGVPHDSLIETHATYVQCRRLVFPSPLSTRANMQPSPSCFAFFEHLKNMYEGAHASTPPKLIVFTREGFPTSRRMINESKLLERLKSIGFTIVAPHTLSMEDEINILANADILISQLGAALSNIAFAPAGCTIIEIGTDNYTSNEYWYLSHLLGQKYVRVMVQPLSEGFESVSHFRFSAPIEQIETIVRSILADEMPEFVSPSPGDLSV